MNSTFGAFLIITISLTTSGCISLPKGDGGTIGNPTPAVFLYTSQIKHAQAVCDQVEDQESKNRFYKWGIERGHFISEYRELNPEFINKELEYADEYARAWSGMSSIERIEFCRGYHDDVSWAKEKVAWTIMVKSQRFFHYFAPLSDDFNRQVKGISIASNIASAVLTAGIAPGASSAAVGSIASEQYNSAESVNALSAPSSLPCKSYEPFWNANKLIHSGFFSKYYSIIVC